MRKKSAPFDGCAKESRMRHVCHLLLTMKFTAELKIGTAPKGHRETSAAVARK
jgi:hypothetical protein